MLIIKENKKHHIIKIWDLKNLKGGCVKYQHYTREEAIADYKKLIEKGLIK